jgi:hypothetical protein
MLNLPLETWERLIIWMVLGIIFYFAYGYRHSEIRKAPRQKLPDGREDNLTGWISIYSSFTSASVLYTEGERINPSTYVELESRLQQSR